MANGKWLLVAAIALLLLVVPVTARARASAPGIWSAGLTTTLDREACDRRAAFVMQGSERIQNVRATDRGIFGTYGTTRALIRCATDNNFVFFVAAGSSENDMKQIVRWMREAF